MRSYHKKSLRIIVSFLTVLLLAAMTAVTANAATDGAVALNKAFTMDTTSILLLSGIAVLVIAIVVVVIIFIRVMKKNKAEDVPAPGYVPAPQKPQVKVKSNARTSNQPTQMPRGDVPRYDAAQNQPGYGNGANGFGVNRKNESFIDNARSEYRSSAPNGYRYQANPTPENTMAADRQDVERSQYAAPAAGYQNNLRSEYAQPVASYQDDRRSEYAQPAASYQDDRRSEYAPPAASYQNDRRSEYVRSVAVEQEEKRSEFAAPVAEKEEDKPSEFAVPVAEKEEDKPFEFAAPVAEKEEDKPSEFAAPVAEKEDDKRSEYAVSVDQPNNAYQEPAPVNKEVAPQYQAPAAGYQYNAPVQNPAPTGYQYNAPVQNPAPTGYQYNAPVQNPAPTGYQYNAPVQNPAPTGYQYNAPVQNPAPTGYQNPAQTGYRNAAPAAGYPAYQYDDSAHTTLLEGNAAGFVMMRRNGGERFYINKNEFYIGKERAKVDYCVTNNNSVSRKHARIRVQGGKCFICDLGSTNGSYVNGTRLAPNQEMGLVSGDIVKLSNEEFEFLG